MQGPPAGPCPELSAIDGLRPSSRRKSKVRSALAIGMPFVIVALDGDPIVTASPVCVTSHEHMFAYLYCRTIAVREKSAWRGKIESRGPTNDAGQSGISV